MIMRWILAFFIVATGFYLLVGKATTRNLAIRRILFVVFVAIGVASLIFQDQWTEISSFLGVESGTALLTYFIAFAFTSNVISVFRWRQKYEEQIVILTREIAFLKVQDKES